MNFRKLNYMLGALLLAAACSAQASDYYADFGGQTGMTSLVDKFVNHVLEDKRIADYFATANIPKLKQQLAIQFCQELDGPCKYTGLDMKKTHSDLGVTKSAFNSLAEDLIWAMNEQNIPLPAQNALIAKLAPMERDVVTQ
jgi:hemoglobin